MSLLWMGFAGAAVSIALGAVIGAADSWPLGVAGVVGAQLVVFAGAFLSWPAWPAWVLAAAVGAAGGLGFHGPLLALYLALLTAFLVLNDRGARAWRQLSVLFVRDARAMPGKTRTATTVADPVAREFSRARRASTPLTVVSIAAADPHGHRRELVRAARALAPAIRRTDLIVHTLRERMVIVLPETSAAAAELLLQRAFAEDDALRIGTATFPIDGVSWERLKEIALARETVRRTTAIQSVGAGGSR